MNKDFWKNKTVLVTGHTGFKGSWLTRILINLGANVIGYSLPAKNDSLYSAIIPNDEVMSFESDIRDSDSLLGVFEKTKPEIVFHLAAQPLVLEAYDKPAYTFDVNVQGTVNVLDSIRKTKTAKSVVIITTDKVYYNREWNYGYRETDRLGDVEPYAASKACAEIVTRSFYETFLMKEAIPVSTTRAGNVIGGGDTSENRIVPDCIRAARSNTRILLRNPYSIRPYQHVLEPLSAYMIIAERQWHDVIYADQYNVGPYDSDCITTGKLADIFCKLWGEDLRWESIQKENAPHESNFLKLDCSKIIANIGWKPKWDIEKAVEKTIEWERAVDKIDITDSQINEYMK